jgi:RNA recognition motif-containing protein
VCFESVEAATNAMAKFQGHPFFDKPVRIQFARNKSDMVAKMDGTFVEREKKEKTPSTSVSHVPKPVSMDVSAPMKVCHWMHSTFLVPNDSIPLFSSF